MERLDYREMRTAVLFWIQDCTIGMKLAYRIKQEIWTERLLTDGCGSLHKRALQHYYYTDYPSPAQPFQTPASGFENNPVRTSFAGPPLAVFAIVGVRSPPVPVSSPRAELFDSEDLDN
jgi:hypothetical protein